MNNDELELHESLMDLVRKSMFISQLAPSSAPRWDFCPGKVEKKEFIGAAPARELDL